MNNNFKEAAEKYATVITGAFLHQESMTTKDLSTKSFLAGCEHAAPKWIDVKEHRPPYYKRVLAYLESNALLVVWLASDGESDQWTIDGTPYLVQSEVTYWQELPSPPSIQKLNPLTN